MGQLHTQTINYFKAPGDYFWRWADDGDVIEWSNGPTICYRAELINDLQQLTDNFPPLGTILLALSAGIPSREDQRISLLMKDNIAAFLDKHPFLFLETNIKDEQNDILEFLEIIHALPRKYWKGAERTLLLKTIADCQSPFYTKKKVQSILNTFQSRELEHAIVHKYSDRYIEQLKIDSKLLRVFLKRYPDTDILERELEIGMELLPVAAPIEIPVIAVPEQPEQDLLDQLLEDPKTHVLAVLTRKLIAAMHLPMHTKGTSNTSFGGVSDITNRGNYDRLLLSELAYDDDTLMARLANNEALYLRREELPENEETQRFILIDQSIKMWGVPRILAMAAALACAIDYRSNAEIIPFALLGDHYQPADLASKAGIIAALQLLSPALHSGEALTAFTTAYTLNNKQEYFLITEEQLFHAPAFQQSFSVLRQSNGFLITINRNSDVQLYRYAAGHRKLISSTNLKSQSAIPTPLTPRVEDRYGIPGLPVFLNMHPYPLRLPTSGSLIHASSTCFIPTLGAFSITETQLLLWWENRQKGAIEICYNFPKSNRYYWGHDGDKLLYILFHDKATDHLQLYCLQPDTLQLTATKMINMHPFNMMGAAFDGKCFYVKLGQDSFATITAATAEYELSHHLPAHMDEPTFQQLEQKRDKYTSKQIKQFISFSYSTLNRIDQIFINKRDCIVINNHRIAYNARDIVLQSNTPRSIAERGSGDLLKGTTKTTIHLPNTDQHLLKMKWENGSEAWVDSCRGILHLRSADTTIPEISILLIINKATACWSSDGYACGPASFTGDNNNIIPAGEFYKLYIHRFIQAL
jgi:hypothetical protein